MGTPREPKPAKFFVALLSSTHELLSQAENDLMALMGQIDGRTAVLPWNVSKYYEQEMGLGLLRCFAGFSSLLSPEGLAELKLKTQVIEDGYRDSAGARRIIIDPGYLDAHKVVQIGRASCRERV